MQDKNRYALKEWAIVLKALTEGRQTLLLRKGGLIEKQKRFTVEHPEFFIYPTYLHQQRKGVVPEMAADLDQLLISPPSEDQVILTHYAVVRTAVPITDLEMLSRLGEHHVFTSDEVSKRFAYGKAPGLNLLLIRVCRLPQPFCLPILPHYAGCRSWVDLGRELPTAGCRPVLNDDVFDRKITDILAIAKPVNPSSPGLKGT